MIVSSLWRSCAAALLILATLALVLTSCIDLGSKKLEETLDEVGVYPGASKVGEEYTPGQYSLPPLLVRSYETTSERDQVLSYYAERMEKKKGWHSDSNSEGLILFWKIETKSVEQNGQTFKAPVITESAALEWGCPSSVHRDSECFQLSAPRLEHEEINVHITPRGFDRRVISASADHPVELWFVSEDTTRSHNFAIYRDEAATQKVFIGNSIFLSGRTFYFATPGKGTYYFRCDEHPETENGTFVVR